MLTAYQPEPQQSSCRTPGNHAKTLIRSAVRSDFSFFGPVAFSRLSLLQLFRQTGVGSYYVIKFDQAIVSAAQVVL